MGHIPIRKCISCGSRKDKSEFVRLVKKNNQVIIDKTGKIEGRGAYICNSIDCINKAYKLKRIEKFFKINVRQDFYEELKEILIDK